MTERAPDAMAVILSAMLNPSFPARSLPVHDLTARRCEPCSDRSGEVECHDGPLYRYAEANDFRAEYAGQCECACHLPQVAFTVTATE